MTPIRFYEHFACAYGTIWLFTLGLAFLTQSHIDTGEWGLFGFPIIALIYALYRRANDSETVDQIEMLRADVERLRRQSQQGPDSQ